MLRGAAVAAAPLRIAVAYSGGRDSTALLHVTARLASPLGMEVVALHVHHGLMREADAWLDFAQRQVGRWRQAGLPVRLVSARLQGKPAKGESVEAWARRERRDALARMARDEGVGAILLAHHRRDQAETVLLQALRGAGPAGLAAMPRATQRDGLWWLRPWLRMRREAIDAYVRQHQLRFVDDASNTDERFARSRLRKQAWAGLTQAFADAETTLAAVAHRAQEAQALLAEVAASDLAAIVDDARCLHVPNWRALSEARRINALRAWLHAGLGRGAAEALIERLMVQLPAATAARWPVDGDRQLVLYRGRLTLVPTERPRAEPPPEETLDLSRPGLHALPHWHGTLEVKRVADGGVPASLLKACRLVARRGGERWQAGPRSTARSLKKQYQAAGIPVSQRAGPLVYADRQLLFVPGLGLDARVRAHAGERRVTLALHWLPAQRSDEGRTVAPQTLKSPAL
ncbi:MAG TPA: tRNA lysidine(34) synthetase TilS [Burkholderiaceae bacterium]|nr:tRNA lysidine(34) synthetase TilS [Burkholderiaceae bacterium]